MKIEIELIKNLKEGDHLAFKELYSKYADKLFYFSLKYTKNTDDANEIVQTIFLKVWENRKKLNPELSFNAYLIQIGKNIIYRQYQKRQLEIKYQTLQKETPLSITHNTEEYIIFSELEQKTKDYIGDMPEKRKQVFMLSRIEGFTHEEIAKKLGISVGTVKQHMNQALKSLNKKMLNDGLLTLMLFAAMYV
ncbi:RNA polymerase sigma-70 factor [Flammeovirgaceae bacterium SG7u.111]|nr:RNA polymerase sigma-70 factor [Flammeovirgaceae bacterium SG7u.132]WPO38520.1 RNA polymerase sigma-70 factor [Flammeovirgaceae bacterium SG7u.111]